MTASQPSSGTALCSRLSAVATVMLPAPSAEAAEAEAGELLARLVTHVSRTGSPAEMWLLCAAISTVFPTEDDVREATRAVELRDIGDACRWLLGRCLTVAVNDGRPERGVTVVTRQVIVDVDFSARHTIHTGIQRVVRSTVPHWHRDHPLTLVAWSPAQSALRTLAGDERSRVLNWDAHKPSGGGPPPEPPDEAWDLVIPWQCVIVVPEVPAKGTCERLAALASTSGNRVVAIGYDCIPVVSADLVPPAEPNRFVRYLSAVKHMRRVAGISASATAEFQGFASMLRSQGLSGPTVIECALPSPTGAARRRPAAESAVPPSVVCVGSFEPRKNQEGVLFAAEALWREGLNFELQFIGGGFPDRQLRRRVRRLEAAGRPVRIRTAITEAELEDAYATARFTVFPSIHEGYGLPVAESLAHGTPVITGNYGSTDEIAKAGGAVVIDPRDDLTLVKAMRDLLQDDTVLTGLHVELLQRPARSWSEYAHELWRDLVEPELEAIG